MPDEKLSAEGGLSELAESLTEGIESCRSVIANYKSLLSMDPSETASPLDEKDPDKAAASSNAD